MGQNLSNRGPNHVPPGQTPPIVPGQTTSPPSQTNAQGYDPITWGQNGQHTGYAQVGQARNQPGFVPRGQRPGGTPGYPGGNGPAGAPGAPAPTPEGQGGNLPILNENQAAALHEAFAGQGNFGTAAGPTMAGVRRLMRQGMAAGLRRGQVNNFLNPAFYRGTNDPYGGGRLFHGLDAQTLSDLAKYAGQQTGSGLVHGGSTQAQADFFAAFPELHDRYMSMANVYTHAPDLTNGASTTPPNAVLGSDGKYHNPDMPLPTGVTLGGTPVGAPGSGTGQTATVATTAGSSTGGPATAAQTQANNAQNVSQTPMQAAAAGRDPSKHQAFWHAQGWSMNPATGEWHQHNDNSGNGNGNNSGNNGNGNNGNNNPNPGNGNNNPNPGSGGNGNNGGNPGSGGGGSPALSSLPLDPTFEQQRRYLDDSLSAAMNSVAAARDNLNSYSNVAEGRLATNQDLSVNQFKDSLAGRGLVDSSLYGRGLTNIATDYLRQNQDLGFNLAGQYGDLATQASGAQLSYEQQIQQALTDLANRLAQDTHTVVPRPRPRHPGRRGNGNGNGNGRNR